MVNEFNLTKELCPKGHRIYTGKFYNVCEKGEWGRSIERIILSTPKGRGGYFFRKWKLLKLKRQLNKLHPKEDIIV